MSTACPAAPGGRPGSSRISASWTGGPTSPTFETAPLTHDVTVAGAIRAHVFAATTGSDAELDREADRRVPGHHAADASLRRLRADGGERRLPRSVPEGLRHPHPTPANQVDEYSIDLHTQDYRFLKGHRIMVQVQSTWFPLIDRNPQRYVPNIFEATDADFHAARESIYRSGAHASYIELPIQTGPPAQ